MNNLEQLILDEIKNRSGVQYDSFETACNAGLSLAVQALVTVLGNLMHVK
jgi:hypothetical protein